jgi:hypothetical protein
MRYRLSVSISTSLILYFFPGLYVPAVSAPVNIATFSQNETGIKFSGGDTATLSVAASNSFNVGDGDFTIDWWQKAPSTQSIYPRLFQFGDGAANSDGFAVSEEGGNLYFWMDSRTAGTRGGPRVSLSLPVVTDTWFHYAVVRNGSTITLYFDGTSVNSYTETPTDPNDLFAPQSTLHTPTGIEYLDLIIGGSNDDSLGAFQGEITGFEFIRGARWSSNFTPPTIYTNESCLNRDANNICDQERVLLIYPTSDFNQAGGQLTNRVNGEVISHAPGVTYGNSIPPQNTNYPEVELISSFGGQICAEELLNQNICADTSTVSFSRETSTGFTIYIEPNSNFQTDSITIAPIGAESVTVSIQTDSFTVRNADNHEFEFQLYDDGELNVPDGMTHFSISADFSPEKIDVDLLASPHGRLCINIGLGQSRCSDTNTATVSQLRSSQSIILINPDTGYEVESISVTPKYSDTVTVDANTESFTVTTDISEDFIIDWYAPDGELSIPAGITDIAVSVIFAAIPGYSNTNGMLNTSRLVGGPALFGSGLFIVSSTDQDNDYSAIESVIMDIQYRPNNPLSPSSSNARMSCRMYLDFDLYSSDSSALIVNPPPIVLLNEICLDYHQSNSLTSARLFFMDAAEPFNYDEIDIDPAHVLQNLDIDFISPPGIEVFISGPEVDYADVVQLKVSNLDKATQVRTFINSDDFQQDWCELTQRIDSAGPVIPNFIDENSGYVQFNAPTISEINTNCSQYFVPGIESFNPSISHDIYFQVVDDGDQGEINSFLALRAVSANTPSQQNSPTPQIQSFFPIPAPVETVVEEKSKEPIKINNLPTKPKPEPALNTSWCIKKGIWIYTVSGKLQMCDPATKTAIEMPACAGRADTPTYPWVFRATRFYSGVIPTKSGTYLYNAIFFYKGLAISGSNNVSAKPCSSGSVFIPMKYSKTLFDFARRERPLIWVKAS